MATTTEKPAGKTEGKAPVRKIWGEISSDEDEKSSNESQPDVSKTPHVQQPQKESAPEDHKKKDSHIVPFDPKKRFHGDYKGINLIKGGIKPEKLERKKFILDTVKNPFDYNLEESQDQKKEQNSSDAEESQKEEPKKEEAKKEARMSKKDRKQREKQELQAALRQINGGKQQQEAVEQLEKKKKKKKPKKEEEEPKKEEESKKEENTGQQVKEEAPTLTKEQLEELMRKKKTEGTKEKRRDPKAIGITAAKRALQEREAKNKGKKVFVDL